jgi:hypothetical protein
MSCHVVEHIDRLWFIQYIISLSEDMHSPEQFCYLVRVFKICKCFNGIVFYWLSRSCFTGGLTMEVSNVVLWVVTPCILVSGYQHFGMWRPYVPPRRYNHGVATRRPPSTPSPLWEPQVSNNAQLYLGTVGLHIFSKYFLWYFVRLIGSSSIGQGLWRLGGQH